LREITLSSCIIGFEVENIDLVIADDYGFSWTYPYYFG